MREIAGSTILITGGTGSFGTAFAKHALSHGAEEVRIFSRDEFKQGEMRASLVDSRLRFFLGDVRSPQSIRNAMVGVNFVFHAAALKQVPSCEFFPLDATETNVLGSSNVVQSAIDAGVQSVVCLSTDKAVYPVNAMGMSKGLMEKMVQAYARSYDKSDTALSIVRYGNVLYSRGSVVPLFVSQLAQGKPLSLTDPHMTRFLMTLDESVELVMFALANASSGDLFVRKAPAATVENLARAVCAEAGKDFDPVIIGNRHGEKVFETLLSREERIRSLDHGTFFRVPMDERSLDYGPFVDRGEPELALVEDYTSHNTEQLDVSQVRAILTGLAPFARDIRSI